MRIEDRIRVEFQPIRSLRGVDDIVRGARRRTRIRRLVWTVPLVAVLAATAVLLSAIVPGGGTPAEAAFRQLADTAARRPADTVGEGQYLYSTLRARWQTCDGPEQEDCRWDEIVREQWQAVDGSGRIHEIRGPDEWSQPFGPGGLSVLPDLPDDADALRDYVRERASHADQPMDYEMFVVVGDLLRETFFSPPQHANTQLRRSLFEIASGIRGVELLGTARDEDGRAGIGFGFTRGDSRLELIFDPETSELLGEREVSLENGRTIPGSWVVYGRTAVVDSTDARP